MGELVSIRILELVKPIIIKRGKWKLANWKWKQNNKKRRKLIKIWIIKFEPKYRARLVY